MPTITNKHSVIQYTWGNKCLGWPLVDTAALSVKQEAMPAGTREQLHFHKNAQQYFFILKGTATFFCNNDECIVSSGTGILIEANVKHYIANQSAADLEFLVISQPSTQNDRVNIQ